ncbi:hypothetical protein PR048_009719 [Dryococelus australis]|uniref:Integrase catalytic domain-containing protein n=1 Tax=Dryococelus australis TaxID=614101 RepID=A0ABQ9I1G6_9NEOP|nr:hypothetical protein PR048_009719 [Dryococelus australis]
MLQRIHEGHVGIIKCQEASSRLGMVAQHHRALPMEITALSHGQWLSLGMDIFEIGRQKYIVIQDYSSRFFEVVQLPNTTKATTVTQIKNIFAWHGIPEVVHTDGAEFKHFAKDYEFALSTSSPKFAQSNANIVQIRRPQPRFSYLQRNTPIKCVIPFRTPVWQKTEKHLADSPYQSTDIEAISRP